MTAKKAHGKRGRYQPQRARERRRVYKVERLPIDARQRVLDGFAAGRDYEEIKKAVAKTGAKISTGALSNFWRDRWRDEETRLKRSRELAARIEKAMAAVSPTPLAVVGRELLFTRVFEKLEEMDQASLWQLLREARELHRATRGEQLQGTGKRKGLSTVEQAREVRRRWRELYGLDDNSHADCKS